MAKQHLFTQGSYTKSIDPWHSDGAMWRYNSNPPATEADDLYARVAAVYRAINFTADTLANMPFAIVNDKSGKEIDTSEEYKNAVGFLPYPRLLLRLMAQSFLVTNRAYAFQESKGRTIRNLRYIAPSTIQTITDPVTGDLTGFKRTIQASTKDYMIDAQGFCNIVYAFNLNWKQELLPDDQSPYMAMMNAAGVNYYADKFIRDYFERGGIKPVILTFDGTLDTTTAERVESVWSKVIRGVYKYWGKVFSGKFDVKPIGEGIEALKDKDVYNNALRNIAIAIGMPQDALLQNADSYATAQVHKSTWFSDTLTPLSMALSEPLNEQVFKRLGYRFEFRPEVADPDMEEERQRVASAQVLFDILSKGNRKDADKAALETLGIDLPQWFTWEENEEPEPVMESSSDTEEEENTSTQAPQAPKPNQPSASVDDGAEEKSIPLISVPALREMQNWQDLAFRKLKKSMPLTFDWEARDIPSEIADGIRSRLATATDEAGIKAAFEVSQTSDNLLTIPSQTDNEIKTLAEALNNMAAAMKVQPVEIKAETITPPPQPIIVNLTTQMPAPGEPSVTFAPVIQPSDVAVTVTNEVQPTPIENNVTVQPAKVERPKKAKVIRDMDGRITGIES